MQPDSIIKHSNNYTLFFNIKSEKSEMRTFDSLQHWKRKLHSLHFFSACLLSLLLPMRTIIALVHRTYHTVKKKERRYCTTKWNEMLELTFKAPLSTTTDRSRLKRLLLLMLKPYAYCCRRITHILNTQHNKRSTIYSISVPPRNNVIHSHIQTRTYKHTRARNTSFVSFSFA